MLQLHAIQSNLSDFAARLRDRALEKKRTIALSMMRFARSLTCAHAMKKA